MAKREPNVALGRLLTESRWTHQQFARAVNRVGTETGVPLRYDESAVTGSEALSLAARYTDASSKPSPAASAAPSPTLRPGCRFHTIAPLLLRIPWKG
ncbi:hypothetical protein [Streptomyces pilosus]|uniref:hypothetical protein n=1 Tax=Streptomyces pilosus TaxID=28893 RepID=UPI00362D336C